jgi:hypothetical protein
LRQAVAQVPGERGGGAVGPGACGVDGHGLPLPIIGGTRLMGRCRQRQII